MLKQWSFVSCITPLIWDLLDVTFSSDRVKLQYIKLVAADRVLGIIEYTAVVRLLYKEGGNTHTHQ